MSHFKKKVLFFLRQKNMLNPSEKCSLKLHVCLRYFSSVLFPPVLLLPGCTRLNRSIICHTFIILSPSYEMFVCCFLPGSLLCLYSCFKIPDICVLHSLLYPTSSSKDHYSKSYSFAVRVALIFPPLREFHQSQRLEGTSMWKSNSLPSAAQAFSKTEQSTVLTLRNLQIWTSKQNRCHLPQSGEHIPCQPWFKTARIHST